MSPLEYIDCINLKNCRHGWKKLNENRAYAIDYLADCINKFQNIRLCSKRIASEYRISYRRLEETAKCVGIIRKRAKGKWDSYGKLIDIRIYISYKKTKRPSWRRHIEISIIITKPLRTKCMNLLKLGFDYWYNFAIDKIIDINPELAEYIESIMEVADDWGFAKYGCRELSPDNYKNLDMDTWCNNIYKSEYNYCKIIVYDYRGGELRAPKYRKEVNCNV